MDLENNTFLQLFLMERKRVYNEGCKVNHLLVHLYFYLHRQITFE